MVESKVERERPAVSKEILKIAAIVIIGIIIVSLFIGFLPMILRLGEKAGEEIGETINPTNFEITSSHLRTQMNGLDYVAYVDFNVHNHGGAGTEVIWCEVSQGSNGWQKSMLVHLESKESRALTFTFTEVSFWTTSDIHSKVWIG